MGFNSLFKGLKLSIFLVFLREYVITSNKMGSVRFVNEFTFFKDKAQIRGSKIVAKNERVVVGIKLRGPPGSAADRFLTTDLESSTFRLLDTLIIPQCFKTNKL